jgi:hypothetical protein
LLKFADLHVTHSSSTVIEAAEFGVPSVVCSDYGAQFFAAQVAAGQAVVAKSEEEIAQALLSLYGAGRREPAAPTPKGTLEAALTRAFPQFARPVPHV